jgi:hypothetical protein
MIQAWRRSRAGRALCWHGVAGEPAQPAGSRGPPVAEDGEISPASLSSNVHSPGRSSGSFPSRPGPERAEFRLSAGYIIAGVSSERAPRGGHHDKSQSRPQMAYSPQDEMAR